ncbi:MAG: helix-turn-helix domain-containing protein [Pikeienuella sp.]
MMEGFGEEQATLGDRIAAGREALGFSQQELAERIGVKVSTLEEWEFDQSAPRASHVQMLSGVLNVSLIWLMSGETEAGDDSEESETDVESMLRALRQLRSDQLRLADRTGRLEKKLRALLAV